MRELATAEAIAELSGPFQWGVLDCYQFSAGVVYRVTGRDFRGLFRYESAREARRLIAEGGGLYALVCGVLGASCDVGECQDGDPVLLDYGREMLGVKFQDCIAVKTERAVQPVPMVLALHGWRV